MMPALALLAGGLATRLRPLTGSIPKSMLDVAGEPFVAHQLRLFQSKGIARVVICTGHFGDRIESFVGDGSRFGLSVAYSLDGKTLLGTGGALKKAMPLLGDEFIVVYGDSWLDTDYGAAVSAFRASGKSALMTVFRNDDAWDSSNVELVAGQIARYDKRNKAPQMHHIDWGMGILTPRAFADWNGEERFDLADVYRDLAKKGELAGYEVKERFYEIGSPEGLAETNAHLRLHHGWA
jgi:NDP-sugar pyrophosphorylase family protein